MIRLTQAQRAALFKGVPVKLTYPGAKPCPIKAGHVEILSTHVRLEITGTRRQKDGDHVLVYTLHNNRLGQRFLAPQDGQTHPEQYQHSGGSTVDFECGQALDGDEQERMTKASKKAEVDALGDLLAALEDLRTAAKERIEMSPTALRLMGRDAWALRAKIDALERRLRRRLAA